MSKILFAQVSHDSAGVLLRASKVYERQLLAYFLSILFSLVCQLTSDNILSGELLCKDRNDVIKYKHLDLSTNSSALSPGKLNIIV